MELLEFIVKNGEFFAMIVCVALAYYIQRMTKDNQNLILSIMESHKEETDNLTAAINNNSLIIRELLVTLQREVQSNDN